MNSFIALTKNNAINLTSSYIGSNKVILPDEYQQVDYIQSTGLEYIDTGAYVFSSTKIDITLSILKCNVRNDSEGQIESQDYNYVGSYGSKKGLALASYSGKLRFWNTAPQTQTYEYEEDKIYNIILNDNSIYSVNGEEQKLTATKVDELQNSIYLFGAQYSGRPGSVFKPGAMKLYNCKIYTDNVLIRELVPCYRKEDKAAGVFDLVSFTFYENSGEGELLIGNDLLVSPIRTQYTI